MGRRYTEKEHTAANFWSALAVKFFSIFSSATATVQDYVGASSAKFRAKTAPFSMNNKTQIMDEEVADSIIKNL